MFFFSCFSLYHNLFFFFPCQLYGFIIRAGYGSIPIVFKVNDVDAEYERIKTLGVEFIMLPTTHPWGARSFWFRDPDGNIIDFKSEVKT
jgi:predicted enzyme related to lactoylglutathione lyase